MFARDNASRDAKIAATGNANDKSRPERSALLGALCALVVVEVNFMSETISGILRKRNRLSPIIS